MLYVQQPAEYVQFWIEKVGFVLLQETHHGEVVSYEIAPSQHSGYSFGIHSKKWVSEMSPELNTSFPSLLLESNQLEKEHQRLKEAGITVHPIEEYNGMLHFTFVDAEGNYIAVTQL